MQNIWFYAVGFIAICCYALLVVISKKVQNSIPPFAFIALTMFVLMSLALIATAMFERSFSIGSLDRTTLLWILLFGIVNLAGFALYLTAISGIPVAHYQLIRSNRTGGCGRVGIRSIG